MIDLPLKRRVQLIIPIAVIVLVNKVIAIPKLNYFK